MYYCWPKCYFSKKETPHVINIFCNKKTAASISLIFGVLISEPEPPPKLYSHQCVRPLSVHIWWFGTDFASEVVLCFSCVASPQVKLPVVFFCSISPDSMQLLFKKKKTLTLVIFIIIPLFTNMFLKLWLCCTTSSYGIPVLLTCDLVRNATHQPVVAAQPKG